MSSIRLFIAEDHAILREGLRALLAASPDIEIVGEAENGRDAVRMVCQLKPQLVLMDLSMPHVNGTEAISLIKRREPDIKIIALTVHKSHEYVRATLDANADGYVLKDDTHQELLTAIRNVIKGNLYLSPGITNNVINGFLDKNADSAGLPGSSGLPSWSTLTGRERQVMKLIAEGNKNKEIAGSLSVSVKTIEKHRSNLMKKLDLHNASAITTYAIQNKMVG
ncbi:MAG: response regulator transcription factor [Gammaproteobacteria bacterium]|nr:response regulator transcription factor [Gammaproteobacteria bacterium]